MERPLVKLPGSSVKDSTVKTLQWRANLRFCGRLMLSDNVSGPANASFGLFNLFESLCSTNNLNLGVLIQD